MTKENTIKLNEAFKSMSIHSDALSVSITKFSEIITQFLEIKRKQTYRKPMKTKRICEILKQTK